MMAYPKLFQYFLKHINESMVIKIVVSIIFEIGADMEIPESIVEDICCHPKKDVVAAGSIDGDVTM